jgi:hypothetical protein
MATLLKVLNNLADIKSAGGVALRVRTQAVQANPSFSALYAFHTAALVQAGREEEARSVAGRLLALEPNFRVQPFMTVFSPFLVKELGELLLAYQHRRRRGTTREPQPSARQGGAGSALSANVKRQSEPAQITALRSLPRGESRPARAACAQLRRRSALR